MKVTAAQTQKYTILQCARCQGAVNNPYLYSWECNLCGATVVLGTPRRDHPLYRNLKHAYVIRKDGLPVQLYLTDGTSKDDEQAAYRLGGMDAVNELRGERTTEDSRTITGMRNWEAVPNRSMHAIVREHSE